jgi:hypothetical protein
MKRSLKIHGLIFLRRMGMLCRKPIPQKTGLRIATTVYPDVRLTPIESEQAVWAETILAGRKGCGYDVLTRTCSKCGVNSLDAFATQCEVATKKTKKA